MEVVKIIERRARPRIETKVKVKVLGQDQDIEVFTGNLSKSGVFFETSEPFAQVGDKIQLQLVLPHAKDPIKVTGKVVRIVAPNLIGQSPGMGIHFLKIETRQARTFDRLIDRLLDARGIGCRKYPRAKSQVVVEIRSKDALRESIADNLSKGGLFLKTDVDGFVLGDTISLVILHPTTKRKFVADAEVIHIRKGESKVLKDFVEGIGVEFIGLTPARRTELTTFMRSILSAQKRKTSKKS